MEIFSTQSRENADSDITHFTPMEVDVDAFTRPGNSMYTLHLFQTIVATMEQTQRIALTLAHKNNQIVHLNLSNSGIHEKGGMMIACALTSANNKIQSLTLDSNLIGNETALLLANALACAGNKIRELSLRNNLIGAAGAVALANCFQNENCRIRVLDLGRNLIHDEAAHDLLVALSHKKCCVHSLRLDGNPMRNEIQTAVSASAQQNGLLFHTMMALLSVHKMGGPLRRLSLPPPKTRVIAAANNTGMINIALDGGASTLSCILHKFVARTNNISKLGHD